MDITLAMLDRFALKLLSRGEHIARIQLADGEHLHAGGPIYEGPNTLELVVFRDGGWKVQEADTWTPTSVALWLSL